MIKGYDDKIRKLEEIRLWVKIKMRGRIFETKKSLNQLFSIRSYIFAHNA